MDAFAAGASAERRIFAPDIQTASESWQSGRMSFLPDRSRQYLCFRGTPAGLDR
ncbi:hypothetical protein [Actibacterium sp. D379-3]